MLQLKKKEEKQNRSCSTWLWSEAARVHLSQSVSPPPQPCWKSDSDSRCQWQIEAIGCKRWPGPLSRDGRCCDSSRRPGSLKLAPDQMLVRPSLHTHAHTCLWVTVNRTVSAKVSAERKKEWFHFLKEWCNKEFQTYATNTYIVIWLHSVILYNCNI